MKQRAIDAFSYMKKPTKQTRHIHEGNMPAVEDIPLHNNRIDFQIGTLLISYTFWIIYLSKDMTMGAFDPDRHIFLYTALYIHFLYNGLLALAIRSIYRSGYLYYHSQTEKYPIQKQPIRIYHMHSLYIGLSLIAEWVVIIKQTTDVPFLPTTPLSFIYYVSMAWLITHAIQHDHLQHHYDQSYQTLHHTETKG